MDRSKVLYSSCVACLGLTCFVIGAIAVGVPYWGFFRNQDQGDSGHFGPWIVCRYNPYGRETCGSNVAQFRPDGTSYMAGIVAAVGVTVLGVYCILSLLQLSMLLSRERICINYSTIMMAKLVISIAATLVAIASAGIFSIQTDDLLHGYTIKRGVSFYLQIILIFTNFFLSVLTAYDLIFSRRSGGDPTTIGADPEGNRAVTIVNPGFGEDPTQPGASPKRGSSRGTSTGRDSPDRGRTRPHVSVTRSSGEPFIPGSARRHHKQGANGVTNGSVSSVTPSNGSVGSITSTSSGPLRSSMKKPKPKPVEEAFGIPNPGFNPTSPSLNRNGSVKKVRIDTRSTEV